MLQLLSDCRKWVNLLSNKRPGGIVDADSIWYVSFRGLVQMGQVPLESN